MCNSGPVSFLDLLKTGSFGGTVWLGTQLWDAGVKKMWLDMPRKGNHVCWKGYPAPCLGIIFRSRVGGGGTRLNRPSLFLHGGVVPKELPRRSRRDCPASAFVQPEAQSGSVREQRW